MTSIIPGSSTSNRIFQGQRKDFIVMRKDTFEYTGTYSYINSEGTTIEYDFTDCVGMMMIKKKKTDTTAIKVIGVSFSTYDYTLTVESDDMDIDAGKYFYDLQIYDADHHMVTKLYGNFIVLQDVTDFEAVIEKEYTIDFNSSLTTEKQSSKIFTILLSTTIANVITPLALYNSNILLDSSISNISTFNKIFNIIFRSSIEMQKQLEITFSTRLSSLIEITTYSNYLYSTMFTSSITNFNLGETEL